MPPSIRLTVVDPGVRRVTPYNSVTGALYIASTDPQSVEDFGRRYKSLTGIDVFHDRILSEEALKASDLDRESLANAVSRRDRPFVKMIELPLEDLLALARQPLYKDFKPNQNVGTGIGNSDGVIIVDLRTHDIGIKGWEEAFEGPEEVARAHDGEPHYSWFGFPKEMRQGEAKFRVDKQDNRRFTYELGNHWTLVDLATGKRYEAS